MPLWLAAHPLVLASKSAARRAVLEAAGIPVEIAPADIDERAVETRAGLDDAEAVAVLLAREKARAVAAQASRSHGARRRPDAGAGRAAVFQGGRSCRRARAACGAARQDPYAAFGRRGGARRHRPFRACRCRAADDAGVFGRFSRRAISMPSAMRRPRASAAISSKAGACSCSSASRAIISPCWACRCCRCSNGCGGRAIWRSRHSCSSSVSPARSRWARPRRRGCSPRRACRCTTPMPPCTSSTRARRRPLIEAAFPGSTRNGKVDRAALGQHVPGDADGAEAAGRDRASAGARRREEVPGAMPRRRRQGRGARHSAAVRDRRRKPGRCDGGGVGAGRDAARTRAGARCQPERLEALLARQMPDAEKRRRADFVVDSGQGVEHARAQVRQILAAVAKMPTRRK